MENKKTARTILAIVVCCVCVTAQMSVQPGIGLGPFRLKATYAENDSRLHWKNVEVRRDKIHKQNVYLIYRKEGLTFFYTQRDSSKNIVSLRESILDSVEISSPLYKVEGSELAVGKKYTDRGGCDKMQAGKDAVLCDTSAAALGIKWFCDPACVVAVIRVVPK